MANLFSVTTTYAAYDGGTSTRNLADRATLVSSAATISDPTTATNTTEKLHYTEVKGGYYYTVALRNDGSVWAWGRNLLGELGLSDTVRYRHTFSPVRIPQLSNITAISTVSGGYSVAVQADGTAWQWGAGRTPSKIHGIKDAVDFTVGPFTTLVRSRNGTVHSWKNPPQKLPDRSSTEAEPKPVLHQIAGLNDVIQTALRCRAGHVFFEMKRKNSSNQWLCRINIRDLRRIYFLHDDIHFLHVYFSNRNQPKSN